VARAWVIGEGMRHAGGAVNGNYYRHQQLVHVSFQPLIFRQLVVFFSHVNQSTVLSAAYFQPKGTSRKSSLPVVAFEVCCLFGLLCLITPVSP
jgi:hypothetical protein